MTLFQRGMNCHIKNNVYGFLLNSNEVIKNMNQNGDRPDFVVKDKDGHKIGLEHFRADVYRV